MTKYLDQNGLAYFWTKIKAWLSSHAPVKYFGYNWNVDTNDDYALVVGDGVDENTPADSFKIKHNGDIVIGDGDALSDESSIWFQSENRLSRVIRFLTNHNDAAGDGLVLGSGGSLIIGSGESSENLRDALNVDPGDEVTYIASDSDIEFYTNCDTIANRGKLVLTTDNNLTFVHQAIDRDGANPSSDKWAPSIIVKDKDEDDIVYFTTVHRSDGSIDTGIYVHNEVSGNDISNGFYVGVDGSGNRRAAFTEPKAWRKALGLGTNGEFPLTIAQGGSGMTSQQYITDVNTILTAASGITVTDVAFERWGQVCMLRVAFKKNAAISVSANGDTTDFHVATIKTGYRPDVYIYAVGCYSGEHAKCTMQSDGKIICTAFEGTGSARSIAANTGIATYGVYMLHT